MQTVAWVIISSNYNISLYKEQAAAFDAVTRVRGIVKGLVLEEEALAAVTAAYMQGRQDERLGSYRE